MRKKVKLVCGVGINDAEEPVQKRSACIREDGRKVYKLDWCCDFYCTWTRMLSRCYSEKSLARLPTYIGCPVCDDWWKLSNFKEWMNNQKWEGLELDKDILYRGNKVYSPETCVFVEARVNSFILDRRHSKYDLPPGVSYYKRYGKYQAQCKSFAGVDTFLGYHGTPEEAHQAWLSFKLEQAKLLAAEQDDPRVAKALIDRYENYKAA